MTRELSHHLPIQIMSRSELISLDRRHRRPDAHLVERAIASRCIAAAVDRAHDPGGDLVVGGDAAAALAGLREDLVAEPAQRGQLFVVVGQSEGLADRGRDEAALAAAVRALGRGVGRADDARLRLVPLVGVTLEDPRP